MFYEKRTVLENACITEDGWGQFRLLQGGRCSSGTTLDYYTPPEAERGRVGTFEIVVRFTPKDGK